MPVEDFRGGGGGGGSCFVSVSGRQVYFLSPPPGVFIPLNFEF
jgi:hypothetical protein